MENTRTDLVDQYQCPGCINGVRATCHQYKESPAGCDNHHASTFSSAGGRFVLGLPKGFCRFGRSEVHGLGVYNSYDELLDTEPNLRTMFSVPVWKHLDEHGNTIVRWFSPRTNAGWSTVIGGDCRDRMPQAVEITNEQIDGMD